jgi:N-acetylglucosamine kinase-like BadF-type ATPase
MPSGEREQRLIIGVDGGQTKTLTLLMDETGRILGAGVAGPCNHIHEPGGLERQYKALQASWERAFASAGLSPRRVAVAYLGLTGSGNEAVARSVYETDQVLLKGDTITALAGAFPSMSGTIVIAGTGAVAYGQNAAGKSWLAGGMGYYLGDEGSGSDIAQRAFRAVYQANDGRAAPTLLTDLILEQFDCPDLKTLHRRVYSGEFSRDQLAQAAGKVGEAAVRGDAAAIDILRAAGEELGRAAAAVLMHIDAIDVPTSIAPVGGVFEAGEWVTAPMMARVQQLNPQASLVIPRFGPAVGAALLGLRELNITIDEQVLANIEGTHSRLAQPTSGGQ